MIIVGIHLGHDAAISLIKDDKLVATTSVERLSRIKKDLYITKEQLEFFLSGWDVKLEDIDFITLTAWAKELAPWMSIYSPHGTRYPLTTFGSWSAETPILNHIEGEPRPEKTEWGYTLPNLIQRTSLPYGSEDINLAKGFALNIRIDGVDKIFRGHFVDHHAAHAASAFFTSNFNKASIFTVDASMHHDLACSGYWVGDDTQLHFFRNPGYMLGNFYDVATEYLGIGPGTLKAGTLMGLAAYGRIKREAYDKWEEWTEPQFNRKIEREEWRYIDWLFSQISGRFPLEKREERPEVLAKEPGHDHFNRRWQFPFLKEESTTQEAMDIAATIQFITERSLVKYTQDLYEETEKFNDGNLCVSGGTFLNCNANYKIHTETDFDKMHMFPACGDDGTSAGGALWYLHYTLGVPRQDYSTSELAYTGITWDDTYLEGGQPLDLDFIADQLNEDKIICWFDGRSENGPRALGHRSFITSPKNPEMKDILNSRVKFREWYRPFAPIVLQEKAQDWFVMDFDSPFMLHTVPCKRPFEIPSAVHIDNTARVQTLTKDHNSKLYELIEKFESISGIPIVINTSLNVKGEPIVETPDDAMRLFQESDVDVLVINNKMWIKNEQ